MSTVQSVKRPRVAGYQNQIPSKSGTKLYLESKMADVYFTFTRDDGSTKRVPAHKLLLAAASDVFEAIFYGDVKEEDDIQALDVSDAAFEEFLQFFYMSHVNLTAENVAEVMALGHKYNVTKCVELCVQFVKDHPINENTCTWLNAAILYEQTELLQLCEKQIVVNASAVFKSAGFLACDRRVLEHILKMNSLLSCSEAEVFEACMEWVNARGKQDVVSKELVQEHLGDLFHKIRFTSMAEKDFLAIGLSHKNLFSSDEYEDIIRQFAGKGLSVLFNSNPRQGKWNEDAVIVCDRKMANSSPHFVKIPSYFTTIFSSNDLILFGGFICAKVRNTMCQVLESDLAIDVTVFDASDPNIKRILSNFKSSLPLNIDKEILLPNPILIRPGSSYEMHMIQSPESHCYLGKELKSEVRLDSGVTIKFEEHYPSPCIVNLVTVLLFNSFVQ